jgi:hypothetical protein
MQRGLVEQIHLVNAQPRRCPEGGLLFETLDIGLKHQANGLFVYSDLIRQFNK